MRAAMLSAVVLVAAPFAALAACPPKLPAGVYCGAPDVAGAPAGTYKIDPNHTAVIARVSHLGYSRSVFRFDKVSGTLEWDAAAPQRSKLTAEVDTASIDTPVPGFPAELSGAPYLNAAAFPKATFVTTAFHRRDATHGDAVGQFTFHGVTEPMIFHVTLVGAGKGFGKPRIGFEAVSELTPADFHLSPLFADPIQLVIDGEFVGT
jgi:polyisoprenoid-binding protein YceI